MQVAEKGRAGSVILCMLPDTGERYLSTPLFEGITDDMDEDEDRDLEVDAGLSDAVSEFRASPGMRGRSDGSAGSAGLQTRSESRADLETRAPSESMSTPQIMGCSNAPPANCI